MIKEDIENNLKDSLDVSFLKLLMKVTCIMFLTVQNLILK